MIKIKSISRQLGQIPALFIFIFILLSLHGCVQTTDHTPASATISQEAQFLASGTQEKEGVAPDTIPSSRPPATLTATATVPPFPECVPSNEHDSLEEVGFTDYPQTIQEYLNQGATLADLLADLEELGIVNTPIPFQQVDLDLDGTGDLVLSIVNPQSEAISREGTLLIYMCQEGHYVRAFEQSPEEGSGAPAILHVRDLNDDGFPEVVSSSKSCGAHTCFESLQLLSWTGKGMGNLLADSTGDIPFPNVQLTDYDQDHVYTLEVVGKGFGSVGAGPQRDVRFIWNYSPDLGEWKISEKSLGSSNYRIHVIHDADVAFKRGEYQVALLLYSQAFNDPELLDWVDPVMEQLNIGGYARYKSVVAYAAMGDLPTAREFYTQMAAFIQPGLAQRVYVQMAQLFLEGAESESISAGCAAAKEYASANQKDVLDPLGPDVYGYTNREFTLEDLCPNQ